MPEIKSMKDLQNALLPVMKDMTDKLADQVYKTLNYFLQSYYDSYDPIYYRRQYDFLRSAIKVGARRRGKTVTAYVYIDTDSMDNGYIFVATFKAFTELGRNDKDFGEFLHWLIADGKYTEINGKTWIDLDIDRSTRDSGTVHGKLDYLTALVKQYFTVIKNVA